MTGKCPCYFFNTDTTGEKKFEVFFTESENLDINRYKNIGVIKSDLKFNDNDLFYFRKEIDRMLNEGDWNRNDLLTLFKRILTNFDHIEKKLHLDNHL